jgi:hypothetical protein
MSPTTTPATAATGTSPARATAALMSPPGFAVRERDSLRAGGPPGARPGGPWGSCASSRSQPTVWSLSDAGHAGRRRAVGRTQHSSAGSGTRDGGRFCRRRSQLCGTLGMVHVPPPGKPEPGSAGGRWTSSWASCLRRCRLRGLRCAQPELLLRRYGSDSNRARRARQDRSAAGCSRLRRRAHPWDQFVSVARGVIPRAARIPMTTAGCTHIAALRAARLGGARQ